MVPHIPRLHIPRRAIASNTSKTPQNNIGNYLGTYVAVTSRGLLAVVYGYSMKPSSNAELFATAHIESFCSSSKPLRAERDPFILAHGPRKKERKFRGSDISKVAKELEKS